MPEIAVIRNFSRAASDYDANARVQARVARDLLACSLHNSPKTILEPGCGTGLYTQMLLDSFPHATVKAIDASDAMVQVAQERVETSRAWFLCADAETFATGKYDLITSNASFHWFSDLPRAMGNLRGMLNSSGTIMFSYFGPDTYRELQESLASVMGCPAKLACNSFLNAEEIKNLLVQAFRVGDVEEREYQEHFSSLQDLLSNIKLTGTRGSGSDLQITWTRGLMQRLEETYLDRFGSISATYQVYMCRAAK